MAQFGIFARIHNNTYVMLNCYDTLEEANTCRDEAQPSLPTPLEVFDMSPTK